MFDALWTSLSRYQAWTCSVGWVGLDHCFPFTHLLHEPPYGAGS